MAQAATPAASGEAFQRYVFGELVAGVLDQIINCVEDAQRTVGHTTQYFPNIFQRLPSIAFGNLIIRLKQLFSSQDPWALPGPLGTLLEVRGVEIRPLMILHGPFKYP